jgi:hypothetical protein
MHLANNLMKTGDSSEPGRRVIWGCYANNRARAVPKKLAGHEARHDVSVLDQTGRTRVGSINFYSPSHARRNYELVIGCRHRVIQPRSKDHDVRDD